MTRKLGRPRGALPGWEMRIQWWAANGAGYGTPHVPHQWNGGRCCAKCGDPSVALALHVRFRTKPDGTVQRWRVPPACSAHEREIEAATESLLNEHRRNEA